MKAKYQEPDFLDIQLEETNIKVTGLRHADLCVEVQKFIDKAKVYNFPDEWEDLDLFLTGS